MRGEDKAHSNKNILSLVKLQLVFPVFLLHKISLLTEIMTWKSFQIFCFVWDVITYPETNFNSGSANIIGVLCHG